MELNNYLGKLAASEDHREPWLLGYIYLVQALYPFAPHLCSEVWETLEAKHGVLSQL